MFVSGLSRMALEASVVGKVEYADETYVVWLVANLDVNSFYCTRYRVRFSVE